LERMSSPRQIYYPFNNQQDLDECNVFVKYLPSDLSEEQFHALFSEFGTIVSSKIMIDQNTGKSLGFGFVRFETSEDSQRAIKKMNGQQIQNKRLLCKLANQSHNNTDGANQILNHQIPSNNLYIKPLLPTTSEEDLRKLFTPFGNIVTCKVMIDNKTGLSRQIGFVRFETKDEARSAMEAMNNYKLDDSAPPLVIKYEDTKEQKNVRKSIRQVKFDPVTRQPIPTIPPHMMIYYPTSPPMMYMGGISYPPYVGYDYLPFSPPSFPYPPPYPPNMTANVPPPEFASGSPAYPLSWNPEYQPSPYGPGTAKPNYYRNDEFSDGDTSGSEDKDNENNHQSNGGNNDTEPFFNYNDTPDDENEDKSNIYPSSQPISIKQSRN